MPFQPLITVIITNFNHAQWLAKRIDSVLGQTYENLEIIILDDASTDRSREILNEYANNSRIKRIIYNEVNSGSPFPQWQKAFQIADGDLIWIAESDDYSDPALLQNLVYAFEDENCVFAFCEVVEVDAFEKPLTYAPTLPANWYEGKDFLKDKMTLFDSISNTGVAVFRRSTLNNVSNEYLNCQLSGDYRLFCEIIIQGKVFASGLPHAYFRKHEAELTSKLFGTLVNYKEHLEIVDWLIEMNIVGKEVIRSIVKPKLTWLYCVGKGMPHSEYDLWISLSRDSCNKHKVQFPHLAASIKSFQIKAQHFYKRKIKERPWNNVNRIID